MLKDLWNVAGKVTDLEAEIRFFEACGATHVVRDVVSHPNGRQDAFAMLRLGQERVLLFPRAVYESELPAPLHYGLTHIVFEVDDLEAAVSDYASSGVRPFWGPQEVSAGFGRRRIAFFRSPSGFIFEIEQPLAQ